MTYTEKELKEILDRHIRWIKKEGEKWEEMRANLSGADLSGADLSRANLSRAITMNNLYDNKQDCKDESHLMFDDWEWLREEQDKK